MSKLYILCGLIGAGKTTYAIKNFKRFTDLDYMDKNSSKEDQINLTIRLLKKGYEVCHITTLPTNEEINKLQKYNPRYIMIDTPLNRAKNNIIIRNKKRDMENISEVLNRNIEIKNGLKKLNVDMKKIYIWR